MPRLAARFLFLLFVCWTSFAHAQIARVQAPSAKAKSAARTKAIKRARAQAVPPRAVAGIAKTIDARAAKLGETKLDNANLRAALSVAPLRSRLEVLVSASARRGAIVQTFDRRLRGMVKVGKKNRVVSAKKTFFQVTPASFELFPKIMGENIIWFAASSSPGHLHTLVADQDGGPNFTHNTYGTASLEPAAIEREQYMAPVQLTGVEMDRFVRYLNAGVEFGAEKTYGFKTSGGQLVCDTTCTNWATTAPIGELERWVKTVDRRVARAAAEGRLPGKYKQGLHPLLAVMKTPEKRAAIVAEIVAAESLTPHTRAGARRLGKEFELIAKNFPNRPLDLVGRQSLAQLMGVSRSKDPAKWMYDLFLSKRVPIIGVMSREFESGFATKTFDLEIMGQIDPSGRVVEGPSGKLGAIPTPGAAEPPAVEAPTAEP